MGTLARARPGSVSRRRLQARVSSSGTFSCETRVATHVAIFTYPTNITTRMHAYDRQRNGAPELCESQPIATPPHRSFDGKQATLGLLDLALQLLGTWRLTIRVHRLHRSIKRPLDSARYRLCSCSVSTHSSHRGTTTCGKKGVETHHKRSQRYFCRRHWPRGANHAVHPPRDFASLPRNYLGPGSEKPAHRAH